MKQFLRRRISLLTIAIGGFLLMLTIVNLQPAAEHELNTAPARDVSVIQVPRQTVRPSLVGFGTAQAGLKLLAKAEVNGKVTYIHPELKKGAILPKDTLLLKIDDTDYKLALKQAEADLLVNQANYKETELNIKNNQLELDLATKKLNVSESELQRLQKLRKNGSVSQSALDTQELTYLQTQQEVLTYQNQRTTLPSDLAVVEAQIEIAKAAVEQSKRDLEQTEIRLPFSSRIAVVYTEINQYMSTGESLFDAIGLDKMEVNAQFPIDQFSRLSRSFRDNGSLALNFNALPVMSDIIASFGLTATVAMAGNENLVWDAEVERFSDEIDANTRTVGVIVSISDNYLQVEPGRRPPVLDGMYAKVNLLAKPQKYLIVPRYAVHQKELFKVAADKQLQRIPIGNTQSREDMLLLQDGMLAAGDQIIVSDLFPAVDGMLLNPILDRQAQQQLQTWLERAQ